MFHTRDTTTFGPHLSLHKLFSDRADAFRGAAILLAGPLGGALVDNIVGDLFRSPSISRSTDQRLRALIDILALENVDVDGSEEAARFAAIDPADPIVEDICLLTDQLRNAHDSFGSIREGKAAA